MPALSSEPVVTLLVCFLFFAYEAAGAFDAPGIPCALCWARFVQDSGGTRRENAKVWLASLRAIAKQSSLARDGILDCFVAPAQNCSAILSRAPRNDEKGLFEILNRNARRWR
jgi:hypothetical protein